MNQPMANCDVCNESAPYGSHRYHLRKNETYGIFVCDMCREGNHDGWLHKYDDILLNHLKKNGLPEPKRNQKGFLPYE